MPNVDIKIPRELSRFHFLFSLYFAYIYKNDQIYIEKIKLCILDWINTNPPYYGVNWSNAMEAAIRISNWSLVVYALKSEILNDIAFAGLFYDSLAHHVFFIQNNLENIVIKNNHYISNLTGIFVANLLFPILKSSSQLMAWATQELQRELDLMVSKDGGDKEGSTVYHRLVTELFFLPNYLSRHFSKESFSLESQQKLKQMFIFILNNVKPSGQVIQFGDNDSGRLIKLFNRPSLDQRYMLSLAFGLFKDPIFSVKEFDFDILAYMFFGGASKKSFYSKSNSIFDRPSNEFRETGIYILRNRNFYTAVGCIPNGNGIHNHNDKLSFELSLRTFDVIVDPGTFVYVSDAKTRNLFRSTSYHNTVLQNGFEQNAFGRNIFELNDDARVKVTKYKPDFLECEHNGFVKKGGEIHRRTFKLEDDKVTVFDSIDSNDELCAFFHFASRAEY